jgi:hypothetical protein
MPNPIENPFAPKPPLNRDDAEFVGKFVGPEAEQSFRALAGKKRKGGDAPKEDWSDMDIKPEELENMEKAREKEPARVRERFIKWAESIGKDETWVYEIFTFRPDGSVTVDGDLDLDNLGISEFPKGIISIKGYLGLSNNQLTSLEGLPQSIGGGLYLSHNQLTSLEGLPQSIGGDLYLYNNQLTSLEGLPQSIGGNLGLSNNQLTSLEGLPQSIGGGLDLYGIPATSIPIGIEIKGEIYLNSGQTALKEDAENKGYGVRVL